MDPTDPTDPTDPARPTYLEELERQAVAFSLASEEHRARLALEREVARLRRALEVVSFIAGHYAAGDVSCRIIRDLANLALRPPPPD